MNLRNNLLIVEDGLKLFFKSKRKQFFKTKRYRGSSVDICYSIIRDCFNSRKGYFMVSPNNFNQFYARDFGMVCESLLELGFRSEVRRTLIYTMDIYVRHGRVTTQINSRGKPLDFPSSSPESASFMLNSLLLLGDVDLISKYKSFFESEARHIYDFAIDKRSGVVRGDVVFSSMKDMARQVSSCYVNCFVGLFARNLKKIGVKSKFDDFDYSSLILEHFWRGNFFVDDLSGRDVVSGDANVFPFWTGLVRDKKIFSKAFSSLKDRSLDKPFALKYNNKDDVMKWNFLNFLNTNYEHDTVWLHLAVCYFRVLDLFNYKKELKEQLLIHKGLIESQGSFFEVYRGSGRPFRSLVFEHDEAMIWCAQFLSLEKKYL